MPLMLFLGGVGGAALRFGLEKALFKAWPHEPFRWAAFALNFSGCFGFGLLLGDLIASDKPASVHVLLGGAITTFSVFGHELLRLTRSGLYGIAGLRACTGWLVGAGAATAGALTGVQVAQRVL
ncbi:CrcB family protein [Streptomyces sp. NPDC057740]|uniref:FluC/FEX family fluoride channel n=1 Tax=Streptomyces sp. NPDC057740 TaxID=3346234 RepID=UPI0036C406A2